jgi:hypothetical protein
MRAALGERRSHRTWLGIGLCVFVAALAVLQIWAAVAAVVIVAFLAWFARLAISIPAAPEDWKSNDGVLNRRFDQWVLGGLSSGFRNQLPRWLLILAFVILWLSRLDRVREAASPQFLVAASCLLAVASFVLAFSESRSA